MGKKREVLTSNAALHNRNCQWFAIFFFQDTSQPQHKHNTEGKKTPELKMFFCTLYNNSKKTKSNKHI